MENFYKYIDLHRYRRICNPLCLYCANKQEIVHIHNEESQHEEPCSPCCPLIIEAFQPCQEQRLIPMSLKKDGPLHSLHISIRVGHHLIRTMETATSVEMRENSSPFCRSLHSAALGICVISHLFILWCTLEAGCIM